MRGDLKVEVLSDFPERFSPGSVLYLDDQPARVERCRSVKGGLLIKLDLIDDRTGAETVSGQLLTVPRREVSPLAEGSYYHFQIVDMDVRTEEGEYLGRVKQILSTGGNDVYVVSEGSRKELLIPALKDVVIEVNLSENVMTVRLPEGLR